MMKLWNRILIVCAGLLGLSGVLVGAASAHMAGGDFGRLSSEFLLFHAAAIPGVVVWGEGLSRTAIVAGVLLVLGAICFSGDLALLAFAGAHPISGLAPAGGLMLMAGWVGVVASAFARP